MITVKCTKCGKLYDDEKTLPLYEEAKATSTAFSKAKSILKRFGYSLIKIIVRGYSLRYNIDLATVSYCPYCYQEHHHCPRCHTVVPTSLLNTSSKIICSLCNYKFWV